MQEVVVAKRIEQHNGKVGLHFKLPWDCWEYCGAHWFAASYNIPGVPAPLSSDIGKDVCFSYGKKLGKNK